MEGCFARGAHCRFAWHNHAAPRRTHCPPMKHTSLLLFFSSSLFLFSYIIYLLGGDMTLSATQLRSVVNLLSDQGSAANAAGILAREAQARGLPAGDLVAQYESGAAATAPARYNVKTDPSWQDVDDDAAAVHEVNWP